MQFFCTCSCGSKKRIAITVQSYKKFSRSMFSTNMKRVTNLDINACPFKTCHLCNPKEGTAKTLQAKIGLNRYSRSVNIHECVILCMVLNSQPNKKNKKVHER